MKNISTNCLFTFMNIQILGLIFVAYFIINHILGENDIQMQRDLAFEFNNTVLAESYYGMALNGEMMMIYDD